MYIHFAFGSLGKQGKIEEQTNQVIELVLLEKRLLITKCKEFIPAYPKKGTKRIPAKMFKVTGEGQASVTFDLKGDPDWFNELPNDDSIHYLPMEVPMICFIKIAFNQLKTSAHSKEYGKFGLVFSDNYLVNKGIKQVFYYTESSLWNDALIRKWNYDQNKMSKTQKKDLEREILSYRKPATLFSTFKQSVIIKLTRDPQGTRIEYLTYDRYPDNYDFKAEKEHRIVFDEGVEFMTFDEGDLFMIITPNLNTKQMLESFFKDNWHDRPKVVVYPD
jgi:hypothetical protein